MFTLPLKLLQDIHQCIYIRSGVTDFDRCCLKYMQCEIDFVCAVDTNVVHISGHGMELTCCLSMPR